MASEKNKIAKSDPNTSLRTEAERPNKASVDITPINAIVQLTRDVLKAIVAIMLIVNARLTIVAMAGKTTNVAYNVLASFTLSEKLAWGSVGIMGAYTFINSRTKTKRLEHVQKRNQELERQKDVARTSSMLTSIGETSPEDE